MDYQNNCLRVLESFLISFSMILQAVCLAAPGWMTELIKDKRGHYRGLFYFTKCIYVSKDETKCKTKSWHDKHNKDVQGSVTINTLLDDAVYHAIVQAQVMLLVSFVLTVACLVLQYRKNKCKSLSAMVLITAASMSCLVLAVPVEICPDTYSKNTTNCNSGWERTGQMLCIVDTSLSVLMTMRMCLRELCCVLLFGFKPLGAFIISYLSSTYIEINYRVNSYKLMADYSLGFPYCVLLDTVAFVAILFTVILDIIELRNVLQEHFVPGQSIPSESIMMPQLDDSNVTGAATGGHVNSGMAYIYNK